MVYGVASMLGVPDMSGRNLKSLQGTNGHAPRRALSTYDKMQEARARRAALFGEGDPANLPRPAQPCEPDVAPELAQPDAVDKKTHTESRRPAFAPLAPADSETPPPKKGAAIRNLILGLTSLLIVLIAIAAYNIRAAEPVFVPSFAPPLVELGASGAGSPLLVSVSAWNDRTVRFGAHLRLDTVSADRLPLSTTTPPLPAGPLLFDDVETPQTPTRFPSGLTAISGKRPLSRPDTSQQQP